MGKSKDGGILTSANYPATYPYQGDICVKALTLPPDQLLSLEVLDIDTTSEIFLICNNEVIIGVDHDNIGTCHCYPLQAGMTVYLQGNVTFRFYERTSTSRGLMLHYQGNLKFVIKIFTCHLKIFPGQVFFMTVLVVPAQGQAVYPAVQCNTAFQFPGEGYSVTLVDYDDMTLMNTAVPSTTKVTTTITAGPSTTGLTTPTHSRVSTTVPETTSYVNLYPTTLPRTFLPPDFHVSSEGPDLTATTRPSFAQASTTRPTVPSSSQKVLLITPPDITPSTSINPYNKPTDTLPHRSKCRSLPNIN